MTALPAWLHEPLLTPGQGAVIALACGVVAVGLALIVHAFRHADEAED